jgi:hypothetical protein
MTYTYSNHLYEKEGNVILVISGILAILLNINTELKIKLLGMGVALVGLTISYILKSIGKYRGDFKFVIHDKALKVHFMKKIVDFNWTDIDNICEDERGLIIKLNRDNIEFPILNDMEEYEKFKLQLIRKAFEFSFPINVI